MILMYIIIAAFIGSIGSVLLASGMLLLKNVVLNKYVPYIISFAGGTLLGAAFLGMLPKSVTLSDNNNIIFQVVLAAIMFFFILEKIILWRTCQDKDCTRQNSATNSVLLIGDAFHNFVDGIVIASSFLISLPFGIFVTITVFLHEIPQEIGDFAIFIHNGMNKKRALFYNVLSSISTFIGAIGAYFLLDSFKHYIPYALAVSAASFIYIALADLIPQMHNKSHIKDSIKQIMLIFAGIAVILITILVKHHH